MDFNIAIAVYVLTLLGVSFTHGFYSFGGVTILIVGFLLFTYAGRGSSLESKTKGQSILDTLTHTLLLSVTLCLILYGGLYQIDMFGIPQISRILLGVAVLLTATYYLQLRGRIGTFITKHRFFVLVGVMVVVQFLMIISSPEPKIDIYYSLKYGAQSLLRFENPYQVVYPQVYEGKVLNYYSYFPTTLTYYSFFTFLFDPRLGIIFAHVVIAGLVRKMFVRFPSLPKNMSEVSALLFLYYPLLPFITEQSFTDSLTVLLCTILLYQIMQQKQTKLMFTLVLLMNIKQVYFALVPLMMYKLRVIKNLSTLSKTYITGLLLPLPFLLLSARDFVYDTIFIYFQPPQGTVYSASLNIRALLVNAFSFNINPNLLFGVALVYFLYLFTRKDNSHSKNIDIRLLPQFFYGLFIFGGFAYLNHYFLVSQLILLYGLNLLFNSYNSNPSKASKKRD